MQQKYGNESVDDDQPPPLEKEGQESLGVRPFPDNDTADASDEDEMLQESQSQSLLK